MTAATAVRAAVAAAASGAIVAGLAIYPLTMWPLAAAVAVYATIAWRWPQAFLIVLPVVLPAYDLGLWTGSAAINEADLFALATVAVLAVRVPLEAGDIVPRRMAGTVIALFALVSIFAVAHGLAAPLGDTGLSSNPYLRPDNALRLMKGPAEAMLLLPFLGQRQRTHGDAATWLAAGAVLGLMAVALIVLVERALFAGIFDFATDYRVAGPFSSMHVGGGHIGAYTAMALPFAIALGLLSARWLPLASVGGLGGAYTLIVTFARTGYAAGLAGCGLMGLMLVSAFWRRGGPARIVAMVPFVLVIAAVFGGASSSMMRERLMAVAGDMLTRESNWRAGWVVRDHGIFTEAFGMGLGTYQRTMLSRSDVNRPSDFGLGNDGPGRFVWIRAESPFFLGQKIVLPATGAVRLTLRFRSNAAGAGVAWLVCDKVLLYSDHCQGGKAVATNTNTWQDLSVTIPAQGLGSGVLGGLIRRPVEFSVFGTTIGTSIAVQDISLADEAGQQLLTNGDFRADMDRWLFTDDSHVSWRILNQYLMLLFETGVVGLIAYLAVASMAVAGGVRAAFRGNPIGGAVAGSVVSFLLSGLFDNVLEAPRIATLFYLICFAGMLLWDVRPSRPPSDQSA